MSMSRTIDRKISILVVDDDPVSRDVITEAVSENRDYDVVSVENPLKALEIVHTKTLDMIISDLSMPEMDGIELMKKVKQHDNSIDVIIVTGYGTIDSAVKAMKSGASDFLIKPVDLGELELILQKNLSRRKLIEENIELKRRLNQQYQIENIIKGVTPATKNLRTMIYKISQVDSSIMITGESGTGKEVVARCIHNNSNRSTKQFVPVFCSAIPHNLFESELFGYKKGSFTGAIKDKIGLLEYANGGTVFFDEISEVPLDMQVKLLRFLQEQEVQPIGSNVTKKVDIKIIAATNKDLKELVNNNQFREDLFFRLNVLPISIPPLRERREDIPIYIEHFLELYSKEKKKLKLHQSVLESFKNYSWPGNIRELENAIESLVVLAEKEVITFAELPHHLEHLKSQQKISSSIEIPTDNFFTLEQIEELYIKQVLDKTNWKKSKASKILDISRQTLDNKITKYQIIKP